MLIFTSDFYKLQQYLTLSDNSPLEKVPFLL